MSNSSWSASLGWSIAVDLLVRRSWSAVVGAGLLGAIGGHSVPVWAVPEPGKGPPVSTTLPAPSVMRVDPLTGDDIRGKGDAQLPFKTLTHALQVAQPGTVIRLGVGTYSLESGEVFPLRLKSGVIVQGDGETRGQAIVLRGGGPYGSATAPQNVTVVGASQAALVGVTITNPNAQGYGLWIESTQPTVLSNTFTGNEQAGVALSGTAMPLISNNFFYENRTAGVLLQGMARPRIQDNVFEQMAVAIQINQSASPLIIGNRMTLNQQGIVVQDTARPILRGNSVERNQQGGVMIAAQAQPDLGTIAAPGGNWFRNNGPFDVNNQSSGLPIAAVGNEITKPLGRLDITGAPLAGAVSSAPIALPAAAPPAVTAAVPLISAQSFPTPVLSPVVARSPRIVPAPQAAALPVRPLLTSPRATAIRSTAIAQPVLRVPTPTAPVAIAVPPPESLNPTRVSLPGPERAIVMSLDLQRPTAIVPMSVPRTAIAPRPVATSPATNATTNPATNLLPVPDPNAPIGNVGSSPAFVYRGPRADQDSQGQGFPSGRSRARELGYRYRVYVEGVALGQEAQIRAVAPDAFLTRSQGRSILQVGLFQDRSPADAFVQTLSQQGIMAQVEALE